MSQTPATPARGVARLARLAIRRKLGLFRQFADGRTEHHWRCAEGRVMVCIYGAILPSDGKAVQSRRRD
jgi:hypothetical protein